jgi:hypothetical protein
MQIECWVVLCIFQLAKGWAKKLRVGGGSTPGETNDAENKLEATQVLVLLVGISFHAANVYTTSFFAGSLACTLQSFIALDYRVLLALVPWITISNVPCVANYWSWLPFLWYASLFVSYYGAQNPPASAGKKDAQPRSNFINRITLGVYLWGAVAQQTLFECADLVPSALTAYPIWNFSFAVPITLALAWISLKACK